MEGKKRVYLDYAASTPLAKEVFAAMRPYLEKDFGNAGGLYEEGRKAKKTLEDARAAVASALGARKSDIVFTSGGTEANNLAILGALRALARKKRKGVHAVTSVIEHPSVLECFRQLEREGVDVSYVGVSGEGIVDPEILMRAVRAETVFVSLMYANNEIGTLQPVREVGKRLRMRREKGGGKIYFHTDASQAALWYPLDVHALGVDLLTLDAQKMYGPKGIGALYRKEHTPLAPVLFGGSQEEGRRPGTENVALAIGLAKALSQAQTRRAKDNAHTRALQDRLFGLLEKHIPQARINGSRTKRLPNNINVSLPGYEGEFLVIALDEAGFAVSTRSACLGDESGGSYVVRALCGKGNLHESTLRITLGRETSRKDVEEFVFALKKVIAKFTPTTIITSTG